jgi:5-methylcytosine-specific restriction endonuclease McrA
MKFIEKRRNSLGYRRLLELQKIPDSTYDHVSNNVSENDFIRDEVLCSLLEEQGYLCAYCMQKISLSNATIEHIIGQKYVEPDEKEKDKINKLGEKNQINYDNFLAVCEGKSCKDSLHCDKSRANYQKERRLFANPLKNKIMQNIKFNSKGLIYYKNFIEIATIETLNNHTNLDEDSNIRYDIHKVLNLNCQNLKVRREAIINALKRLTNNWTKKGRIETELSKYQRKQSDGYIEFCQVAIYFLNKHTH